MEASKKKVFVLRDTLVELLDGIPSPSRKEKLLILNDLGPEIGMVKEMDSFDESWYKIPLLDESNVYSVTRSSESAYEILLDRIFN